MPDRRSASPARSICATASAAIPSPRPDEAHALVRRRLHVDARRLDAQRARQALGHLAACTGRGAAARRSRSRRRSRRCQPARRANASREQLDAVGAREARVVVGEVLADVALARRPEQRVHHGVRDDVGVGVAIKPGLARRSRPRPAPAAAPSPNRWTSYPMPTPDLIRAAPHCAGGPRTRRSGRRRTPAAARARGRSRGR